MSYLLRRQGTYYFRRVIPVSLRPALNDRAEWVLSLGTHLRREAVRALPYYLIATNEALDAAQAGQPVAQIIPHCPSRPSQPTLNADSAVAVERHVSVKRAPTPLLAIFDAYATEQGLKATTATEWRSIVGKLVAYLGHDDAQRITLKDLDRWRDHLLAEPGKKGRRRSPRTVKDKYISCVRATLNWAVEKRIISDNLAAKVAVRVPRKTKVRDRDFTAAEAAAILSASMAITADRGDYQTRSRRWIPWLCAYSGARVNEVGQLRKADVVLRDGIWAVRITPDAGTVKTDTVRWFPLHNHLIAQGFLAFVDGCEDGPLFYDPARIRKPGGANRYRKKVGEHLRDWVRHEVGIVDPHVQPNHGWRHTFKAIMVELEVPERVADAIQGHAPRSVGQTYGSVSLKTMDAAVQRIPWYLSE